MSWSGALFQCELLCAKNHFDFTLSIWDTFEGNHEWRSAFSTNLNNGICETFGLLCCTTPILGGISDSGLLAFALSSRSAAKLGGIDPCSRKGWYWSFLNSEQLGYLQIFFQAKIQLYIFVEASHNISVNGSFYFENVCVFDSGL